jgi:hypothetical protein
MSEDEAVLDAFRLVSGSSFPVKKAEGGVVNG